MGKGDIAKIGLSYCFEVESVAAKVQLRLDCAHVLDHSVRTLVPGPSDDEVVAAIR